MATSVQYCLFFVLALSRAGSPARIAAMAASVPCLLLIADVACRDKSPMY